MCTVGIVAQSQAAVVVLSQVKGNLHISGNKQLLRSTGGGVVEGTLSIGAIGVCHVPVGIVSGFQEDIAVGGKGCRQLTIYELIFAQILVIFLAAVVGSVDVAHQIVVRYIVRISSTADRTAAVFIAVSGGADGHGVAVAAQRAGVGHHTGGGTGGFLRGFRTVNMLTSLSASLSGGHGNGGRASVVAHAGELGHIVGQRKAGIGAGGAAAAAASGSVAAAGAAGAAVALLIGAADSGNGGHIIDTHGFGAGDLAADVYPVALSDLKILTGDHSPGIGTNLRAVDLVLVRVIGKDALAGAVHNNHRISRALGGGELEVHGGLIVGHGGIVFHPVHGGAHGDYITAKDVSTEVRVHAGVGAGVGHGDDGAAVDADEAVGVDAVTLAAQTRQNVQAAALDGQHRDAVLIDVDAVILREDVHIAAADGQVELRVQALVAGGDIQGAGSLALAADDQRLVGVEGTVDLQALLLDGGTAALILGLQDAEDVAARHIVFRPVCQRDHGTGSGGVHIVGPGGFVLPGVVALVYIMEHHTGRHGTVDGDAVEDQVDLGGGIREGIVTVVLQIHPDLAVPVTLDDVVTGLGDVEHRILIRILSRMHHLRGQGAASGEGGENVARVFGCGIVVDPLLLAVVIHLGKAGGGQLGIVVDVMGNVHRLIPRLGAGEILGRRIADIRMDRGGVCMPGVVVFRHRSAVIDRGMGIGTVCIEGAGQLDGMGCLCRHSRKRSDTAEHHAQNQQISQQLLHDLHFGYSLRFWLESNPG